ncbi:hypothetical protein FLK61_30185 [Paenalkalicoccus suaedae]|uniref:Uncharacterized protein n=1 Tax=Paenalkalicoccus suaedae TaxID=2592382 RepID=A0A859FDM8_9BACI|nr:hypothetical protein [Paenalkalicoccus suaedae]QKS70990.1 hypothetical protein FLK61_30185 [Paenalkalicoccus suaedae]
MPDFQETFSFHSSVLYLVLEIVRDHAQKEWPSPTIRQLSFRIGYSEETILESIEFGTTEPATILQ